VYVIFWSQVTDAPGRLLLTIKVTKTSAKNKMSMAFIQLVYVAEKNIFSPLAKAKGNSICMERKY